MRQDMAKVVSKSRESVRYVRRPGRAVQDLETLPTREAMRSQRYRGRPHIRNAAPLHRWLRAQVGRPWSAVFAELSGRADLRTAMGVGVRERVEDIVLTKVFYEDGIPKAMHKWGGVSNVGTDLFVDPASGRLLAGNAETPRARARREREAAAAIAETKRVIVSTTRQLHKLGNQWYWIDLAPIVPPKQYRPAPFARRDGTEVVFELQTDHSTVCRDVLNDYSYTEVPGPGSYIGAELVKQYGTRTHYGVRKYQASRADIRRHVSQ